MPVYVESKKELELAIQEVPQYRNPKVELEQYVTDASLVAEITWLAYMRGEVEDKRVLDLGCGTGRFAVAAALLGARQVLCLDIDIDAIKQVQELLREVDLPAIDLLVADATRPPLRKQVFDVVFQNPPFGIQERIAAERKGIEIEEGLDIRFLRSALELGRVVYTIHKAPTRDYVLNKIMSWGCVGAEIGVRVITIPPMYKHHYKRLHKVEVVVIRATCAEEEAT